LSERQPVQLLHRAALREVSGQPAVRPRAKPDNGLEAASSHLPTARELEALREQAQHEGFAQGLAEGRREGARRVREELQQQHQEQARQLEQLLETMTAPLAELDEQIEREVLSLVIAMTRQIIRRELRTSPEEVIGAVRNALNQLPVSSRDVRVELHPEDARLVRTRLQETDAGGGRWRIVEDPLLQRGGCRVRTEDSLIDASLEARLGALVSQLFGDQRADESPAAEENGSAGTAAASAPTSIDADNRGGQ
jgi:flagellar assembly protein FliH